MDDDKILSFFLGIVTSLIIYNAIKIPSIIIEEKNE